MTSHSATATVRNAGKVRTRRRAGPSVRVLVEPDTRTGRTTAVGGMWRGLSLAATRTRSLDLEAGLRFSLEGLWHNSSKRPTSGLASSPVSSTMSV